MLCSTSPGYPSCPIVNETIAYANAGTGVNSTGGNSTSGLCALYLPGPGNWRVFYHDNNDLVNRLSSEGGWGSGLPISTKASHNSSIACSFTHQVDMNVFYVDAASSSLYISAYKSNYGWQTRKPLLHTFRLFS